MTDNPKRRSMTPAPKIVWDHRNDNDGGLAWVGDVLLGSWGKVTRGEHAASWFYEVSGVHMRHIAKGRGHVSTEAGAKVAIRRAWAAWWKHAKL